MMFELEVKPYSPTDALENKKLAIPPVIIAAVNELLAARYSGRGSVTITQKELLDKVVDIIPGGSNTIFQMHYFDFEPLFEKTGWRVIYDKPGYNESYEPSWSFSPSSARRG